MPVTRKLLVPGIFLLEALFVYFVLTERYPISGDDYSYIGVSLLWRKRLADLMLFGIGFGLLASGNLLYNALLPSDPFQVPAALHRSSDSINDRLIISWDGFVVTLVRLANLLWVFPPLLLLVALWRRYQPSSKVKMYLALFSMNVAIYFFYPASIGGPPGILPILGAGRGGSLSMDLSRFSTRCPAPVEFRYC